MSKDFESVSNYGEELSASIGRHCAKLRIGFFDNDDHDEVLEKKAILERFVQACTLFGILGSYDESNGMDKRQMASR